MNKKRDLFVEAVLGRTNLPSEVAAAERRRIRRAIAPNLGPLADVILACACETIGSGPCGSCSAKAALKAIDAATKAPRKAHGEAAK